MRGEGPASSQPDEPRTTLRAASTRFGYVLGNEAVSVAVEGVTVRGEDRVLLDADDDLSRGQPWHEHGFTIAPFVSRAAYDTLVCDVARRLESAMQKAHVQLDEPLRLEQYHHYVRDDDRHLAVLHDARAGYKLTDFPVDLDEVTDRISTLVGQAVTASNERHGLHCWHVRVIRPRSNDNNPLHRDVWLDRLRNAINIYVPLAGSNQDSSLPMVPGSHRWRESELVRTARGALIDGVSYTVPAVVGSDRPLRLVRPNPEPNQVLLFSPYLVHGGARNVCADTTRVSLEMRFWRRH